MKEGYWRLIKSIIYWLPVIIIIALMINPMREQFKIVPEETICYEHKCIKYNLEDFTNCKHSGYENTGFLSGVDYWICDEGKMPKRCVGWDWIEVERETMGLGMKCEDREEKA